ncbi:CLUMA_CG012037, isoform A [Clunio marinus]|uniref:CLUMA_CG012037, isoform A n=1 Tax=Clunio marinus TaxID=568069 RepID=A0A1J1IFR1_9DIPT|nr:CLUMA_CG012037, isoform A [Clunio marinus]
MFEDYDSLVISIPNRKGIYKKVYKKAGSVEIGVQNSFDISESVATTDNPTFSHVGINHVEGGWPRDICRFNEEQTIRYCKKQENDYRYLVQMKTMIKTCEHAIFQNNSINLYETYFDDLETINLKEGYSLKVLNTYRNGTKHGVKKIVWTLDEPTYLACCYNGNQNYYDYLIDEKNVINIWDIECPGEPIIKLNSLAQTHCLEYNPKHPKCLISGLVTGQIAEWDVRVNNHSPILLSKRENSHSDCVNAITFYCSKTNMEFFSGSAAGEIFWWDLRNISKPMESLIFNPNAIKNGIRNDEKAFGINVLDYESTFPNKYLVGTDAGTVYICNQKFKNPTDRIHAELQCCQGPISAVQRNSFFPKHFLSVGDWQAKIWYEEFKDSPIFWTKKYESELMHGCWNPIRCSCFYLCRMDGWFDVWDITHNCQQSAISSKLSDYPLLTCTPDKEGKLIAIGSHNGDIHLVEVSENLSSSTAYDRPKMNFVLEHETRREKLLYNKQRESNLKEKEREQNRIHLGLLNCEEVEMNLSNELVQEAEMNFHQLIGQLKQYN